MKIVPLKYIKYDLSAQKHLFEVREIRPEEKDILGFIREAAQRAKKFAGVFVDTIYIANPDLMYSDGRHRPLTYSPNSDSICIHESLLKELGKTFSIFDLTNFLLHELAHHIEHKKPGEISQRLCKDEIWCKMLQKYPFIQWKPWRKELEANIFAAKMGDLQHSVHCASALVKMCRYIRNYTGLHQYTLSEIFSETDVHPSFDTSYAIISDYVSQQKPLKKIRISGRIPYRIGRPESARQTIQNMADGKISADERKQDFERIVKGETGYDFLQSLLTLHPHIETSLDGQGIEVAKLEDEIRQQQVKQFVHDVTILIRCILGSANLYVDADGFFKDDNLPCGSVRSFRGVVTRLVLCENGILHRIVDELHRIDIPKPVLTNAILKIVNLYEQLNSCTFTDQNAFSTSALYAQNLSLMFSKGSRMQTDGADMS